MHHHWRYTIATAGQDHALSRELSSRIMSASTSWRAKARQPIGRRATVSGRSAFSWLRGLPVGSDGDQNGIPGVDHARESESYADLCRTKKQRRTRHTAQCLQMAMARGPWGIRKLNLIAKMRMPLGDISSSSQRPRRRCVVELWVGEHGSRGGP